MHVGEHRAGGRVAEHGDDGGARTTVDGTEFDVEGAHESAPEDDGPGFEAQLPVPRRRRPQAGRDLGRRFLERPDATAVDPDVDAAFPGRRHLEDQPLLRGPHLADPAGAVGYER